MPQISPLRYALHRLMNYKPRLVSAIFWSVVFVIIPIQIPILTGALTDGINGGKTCIYRIIPLRTSDQVNFVLIQIRKHQKDNMVNNSKCR